ncbi:MAG: hypothetical protein J0I86_10200 [Mesorhizobium sp.]|nr:hypothetical protein [Mesorhizobium sp.]
MHRKTQQQAALLGGAAVEHLHGEVGGSQHVEIVALMMDGRKTPLEYLMDIMTDENADEKRRDWAAEKAAAFLHPRPQPVARSIEVELPDTSTVEGITSALNVITQAAASGQIAPAEAQSLSALIEAQRKAIETGELLERIEKLEASQPTR